MKHIVLCLAVVLGSIVSGCGGGGGGGGSGPIAPLNHYEQALVGDYVLTGFDAYVDGVWYDEGDAFSWDGTLSMGANRQAMRWLLLDGETSTHSWTWSASQYLIYADDQIAEYFFNGASLTTDATNPDTGDRVIRYWLRLP